MSVLYEKNSGSALGALTTRVHWKNRCGACTLVNLGLALIGTAVCRRYSKTLGAVVGLGSVALIFLRGYLVPSTPELTKRYLPDSILRYFDHHEALVPTSARSEQIDAAAEHDPLEILVELGVVCKSRPLLS